MTTESPESWVPGFAGPPMHHLYLAAVPRPDMRARMGFLHRQIGAGGEFRSLKLHMTVLSIMHTTRLELGFIDWLCEAIAGLTLPAFDVTFDQFMTFVRPRRKPALVFAPEVPGKELAILSSVLGRAVRSGGFTCCRHPHVTASYGPAIPTVRLEEPIHWPVQELVLIDNWLGLPRYDRLASWALKPPPARAAAEEWQPPRQLPFPGLFD